MKSALRGGESGPAVVSGDLSKSVLWRRVEAGEMPPEGTLSAAEKATLREWIIAGARWGTDPIDRFQFSTEKRAGYDWWSLQPLQAIEPPVHADDDWSRNAIDRFIVNRLRKNGLRPATRADPRTLVRRIYFDLIGLPPPYDVVQKFGRDPTPEAWSRLVESLLKSPHYGERWAQHWLDVARFGETNGYEYNEPREHAWHYRDWVIRSLNADLPYDEFVRMQIAGDILKPNTVDGAAAVGFLVAGVHNTVLGRSEAMKRASRHEELEELAGTTAQAFLGLTVNCSRCHDHKFDPISNAEYYQFVAALDGVTHGNRNISNAVTKQQREELTRRGVELTTRLHKLVSRRGGRVSKTANALQTSDGIAANNRGEEYMVSLKASPTVWSLRKQATTASDGIQFRVLRSDGSVLAEQFVKPGSWEDAGEEQRFKPFRWQYSGDGTGDISLWIGSNPATGRFGGAIDEVLVRDSAGRVLFEEDFDQFRNATNKGIQASTKRTVFWGLQSPRWKRFGVNSLHAVEYEPDNLAAQIFSGWQDVEIRPDSDEERQLFVDLQETQRQLAVQPVFTVAPRDPGVMQILLRGDAASQGPQVGPGGLRAVRSVPSDFRIARDAHDAIRRRRLADWITHRDSGPFHRVIVNRIWHHHFGRGIVETPNDLGFNGGRPSHPQLLDWLAVWFRQKGYSIKKLQRLIVTSATYQQRSIVGHDSNTDEAQQKDADNRLLWRQNMRRLDAETVRDSLLAVSGALNRNQFGPGYRDVRIDRVGSAHYYRAVDPIGSAFNRRTIYRWHVRGERSLLLETFDCPDPATTTPRRNITTTATQALTHWNHAFVLRQSKHLAARIERELPDGDTVSRVKRAWQCVLARNPDQVELDVAVRLVNKHRLALLCRVLFNSSEAIVTD